MALTNDAIITEALELAGDSSLKSRALFWLNRWVIAESGKAPWPHTLQTLGPLAVTGGTGKLFIGTELDGMAGRVHSIRGIHLASASGAVGNHSHLFGHEELQGDNSGRWMRDFERQTGLRVSSQMLQPGTWVLNFAPISRVASYVYVHIQLLPAEGTLADVCEYPNAETAMQAVYAYALKHQNDERQMAEEAKLQRLVQEDRAVYCKLGGNNQRMQLSRRSFPGRVR